MAEQQQGRWLSLAARTTAAERTYTELAEGSWRDLDITTAVRYRGRAEGLAMARDLQLEASGAPAGPAPIEAAMHSVWLHGNWRWLTKNMTTEEREAAADAVQRYSDHQAAQEGGPAEPVADLRWWR